MTPALAELAAALATGDPPAARAADPAAYFTALAPVMADFGLTRVADITGLDAVGLPVVQVCRPGARSNIVTQGKGDSLASAAVGAVLECLEMAAGEDEAALAPAPADWTADEAALWGSLAPDAGPWPDGRDPAVPAWNLRTGRADRVPMAVVSTDFSRYAAARQAPILRHSIGLGAGVTPTAAIWHGLLEVVEADARVRWQVAATPAPRVPAPKSLPEGIARLGLRLGLWDITANPAGPPVIAARVMQSPERGGGLPLPADGFACRQDPALAVRDAVAEALQARLAVISGAREDLTQTVYTHAVPHDALIQEWDRLAPPAVAGTPAASPIGTVAALVSHLDTDVFVVPLLHRPDPGLWVLRTVVPALVADPLRLAGPVR